MKTKQLTNHRRPNSRQSFQGEPKCQPSFQVARSAVAAARSATSTASPPPPPIEPHLGGAPSKWCSVWSARPTCGCSFWVSLKTSKKGYPQKPSNLDVSINLASASPLLVVWVGGLGAKGVFTFWGLGVSSHIPFERAVVQASKPPIQTN